MSNPSGGGSAREATVYRVAHLLQRRCETGDDADTSSLRQLTAQIDSFLGLAREAPPVRMEPVSGEPPATRADVEVELSVVAGVFEPKAPVGGSESAAASPSLLLPTAATAAELDARRIEEAQALLNLMSALTPSAPGRPPVIEGGDMDDDDDSSEVVVMDAADLDNEESSDDEVPAQRRRLIEEMN